jgi:hypothetical protein
MVVVVSRVEGGGGGAGEGQKRELVTSWKGRGVRKRLGDAFSAGGLCANGRRRNGYFSGVITGRGDQQAGPGWARYIARWTCAVTVG